MGRKQNYPRYTRYEGGGQISETGKVRRMMATTVVPLIGRRHSVERGYFARWLVPATLRRGSLTHPASSRSPSQIKFLGVRPYLTRTWRVCRGLSVGLGPLPSASSVKCCEKYSYIQLTAYEISSLFNSMSTVV